MYLAHIGICRCGIPTGNEEIGSYRICRIAGGSRRMTRYGTYIHGEDSVGLRESDAWAVAVDLAHYVVPDPDGIVPVA